MKKPSGSPAPKMSAKEKLTALPKRPIPSKRNRTI